MWIVKIRGVTKCDTLGGMQELTVINESGLYSLILSSKLPNAKKFKHWVTSEVLPAIRKHGMYAIDDLIANPDLGIAALNALKEEREKNKKLEEKTMIQSQQISEMIPKASYYDVVLNCKDLVSIGSIAKDYGWNAKKMNKILHEKGIQFKQGEIWLLYQKYAEKGYKEEVIKDCENTVLSLVNTEDIDSEITKLQGESEIIVELMKSLIYENSRKVMNQDEYNKKYNYYTEKYEKIKSELSKLEDKKQNLKVRRDKIKIFIEDLKSNDKLIDEFDERL